LFFTAPEHEQFMPSSTESTQQWWRAVTLFAAPYWFIFLHEAESNGGHSLETSMAFDEWTLLSLVASTPPQRRRAICRFQRVAESGRWTPRWLQAMWCSSPTEAEARGVIVLQFEGESELRDVRLAPAPTDDGRTLLFRNANSA
jgi:hypothetical protein